MAFKTYASSILENGITVLNSRIIPSKTRGFESGVTTNALMIILQMRSTKMNKKIILVIYLCLLVSSCISKRGSGLTPATLIFVNITNKDDTCLIWTFAGTLDDDLNIKCMSGSDFYAYLEHTIAKKQIIEVSNSYFLICQDNNITYNATADSIYREYGLDGLVRYIENSPPILTDGNKDTFFWAAYILWENDLRVVIGDEEPTWDIEKL